MPGGLHALIHVPRSAPRKPDHPKDCEERMKSRAREHQIPRRSNSERAVGGRQRLWKQNATLPAVRRRLRAPSAYYC
jgi:hypothetical protein